MVQLRSTIERSGGALTPRIMTPKGLASMCPNPTPPHTPIRERLMNNIQILPSGCWEWKLSRDRKGYGYIWFQHRKLKAHRVSAYVFLGFDLKSSLCVLHKCDVPACINPEHLFIGTRADNNNDMARKGRHSGAKLTSKQVIEIRQRSADGEELRALGKEFGVSETTISKVVHRQTWRHVS